MKPNTSLLLLAAGALAGTVVTENMAFDAGVRRRKHPNAMPKRDPSTLSSNKEMPGAWKGDGVPVVGESRQARRARERREQKMSRR